MLYSPAHSSDCCPTGVITCTAENKNCCYVEMLGQNNDVPDAWVVTVRHFCSAVSGLCRGEAIYHVYREHCACAWNAACPVWPPGECNQIEITASCLYVVQISSCSFPCIELGTPPQGGPDEIIVCGD